MPSPLRESCSCWKAEKLRRHFYRKCWTMDFRDGNLHNATLFCSNAQKSCNITKSFLLQCNSLWQKFPKIALHCFPSFHHTNLSPPSQNKTIFFNGFILYFIPTLLLQSLLQVSILPTAAPQSIYYRFHRKQIRTVGLSISGQVEYISLLHEFFQ